MAFAMVLRRLDAGDGVPHGFRSTLKDWSMEQTSFPGLGGSGPGAHPGVGHRDRPTPALTSSTGAGSSWRSGRRTVRVAAAQPEEGGVCRPRLSKGLQGAAKQTLGERVLVAFRAASGIADPQ